MAAKKPCLVLMYPEEKNNAAELEAAVKATGSCDVEIIENAAQLINRVVKGEIEGLVCNVTHFDVPLLAVLTKAKDLCKQMLTVVVSEKTDDKVILELKKIEKIISVDKPNSVKSMTLLCERIVQGRGIAGRKQKRFQTNQKASVQRLESTESLEANVYNMSKGGAYLELVRGVLSVKDVVKVIIQLDALGKEHVVHGRVTWTVNRGLVEDRFGFGVEFMNSDEAYIAMLEKI
jgi:DNA-binding NtrC family response regulator